MCWREINCYTAWPIPELLIHLSHRTCCDRSFPIVAANRTTFQTSWKLLASPKLILTTPNSRPTICSKSFSVTPGYKCVMSSWTPSRAAAPPGLHIQPVRSEIDCDVAACSIKVLGTISPEGWWFISVQSYPPIMIKRTYREEYKRNSRASVGLLTNWL